MPCDAELGGDAYSVMATGSLKLGTAAVAIALCALLAAGIASGARQSRVCPGAHPRVTTHAGSPFVTAHLRVSRMSCMRAITAVRAGAFALTPAGPRFSTPGFSCTSPVGPPRNSAPRYFHCRHGARAFEFTLT